MKRATRGDAGGGNFAGDATEAVRTASRGMRRDVAVLARALRGARLFVPLARSIEEVPVGIDQEVGDELSLSPHFLFDEEGVAFLPVFTRVELVERATNQARWTTGDGPLEYAALPGPVALELALATVDDESVEGLLVNPFDDTELILRRHEIASIAQGRPIPLVGYVSEIPFGDDEKRLVAEMEDPAPPEIVTAIEGVLNDPKSGVPSPRYALSRTFNPERDLEPHLTLNVSGVAADVDRPELAGRLAAALEGLLPPPGYIDILFDEP
jgi:hypothetical protein